MKKIATRILMGLGTLTLVLMLYASGLGIYVWIKKGEIYDKTILEISLGGQLAEYTPDDPIAKMMPGQPLTVRAVVETLEAAGDDERVVGIVARIGGAGMGFAHIQEIRDAVLAFRKKGKKAVAWADTFGEFGPGNGGYYLATAFETIHMQPSGDLGLTGLIMESPFAKGTLEKLGIVPRMDHRKEYKNAMNFFTETKYNEPHKEAVEKVMTSLFGQIARDIGKARNIPEESVRKMIDKGVFLGSEAVDAGLVDTLAYRDEIYDGLKKQFGEDAQTLYLTKYGSRAGLPNDEGETVALVYGVGKVHRGKSQYNPVSGSVTMGSDTVAAAFRAAIDDEDVRAIVFRVNSPGGSYVASDTIWRETVRAKKEKKPVVVSMSNVAGSGGYFVSMAADKIVAEPGTITGSIGVVGGKMLTSGFWEKLGISWDEVHSGKNATLWTGTLDYSPEQWDLFQTWLDRIYDDFTGKVARGRNLPLEKVREIAKGRVWSGEDAKALGLVDELGGLSDAVRLARDAAGIAPDKKVRLKVFPGKKSWQDIIFPKTPENSEEDAETEGAAHLLKEIRPAARSAERIGMSAFPGVLSMPDTTVVY